MSTIHFYIILKQRTPRNHEVGSLSTIHFYIILKHYMIETGEPYCLSTIHFYIILKPSNLKMNCFHLHKTGTQTSDGY